MASRISRAIWIALIGAGIALAWLLLSFALGIGSPAHADTGTGAPVSPLPPASSPVGSAVHSVATTSGAAVATATGVVHHVQDTALDAAATAAPVVADVAATAVHTTAATTNAVATLAESVVTGDLARPVASSVSSVVGAVAPVVSTLEHVPAIVAAAAPPPADLGVGQSTPPAAGALPPATSPASAAIDASTASWFKAATAVHPAAQEAVSGAPPGPAEQNGILSSFASCAAAISCAGSSGGGAGAATLGAAALFAAGLWTLRRRPGAAIAPPGPVCPTDVSPD